MEKETKDISFLLNYQNNIDFVEACYETMLSRPMMPCEIRQSLFQLASGLTKEAFIYRISKSAEFNNRYSIRHHALYSFYFATYILVFKIPQAIMQRLLNTGKIICNYPLRSSGTSSNDISSLSYYSKSFDMEYTVLSLCQISRIPSCILEHTALKSCTVIGHFATDLMPAGIKLNNITEEQFYDPCLFSSSQKSDYFISSPAVTYNVLTNQEFQHFSRLIQDYFIFTMPSLPICEENIGIIWDGNWDNLEIEPDGSYCRWFHGCNSVGNITIFNNSNIYKKVKLEFSVSSLDSKSELFVQFEDSQTHISFREIQQKLALTLYLKPYANKLTFTYIGQGITPTAQQTRLLKFSLRDLTVTDFGSNISLNQINAYELSEKELGSGFYPYYLNNSAVRTALHRNGFFEVSSYYITNSHFVRAGKTSRYNYSKELMNHYCYYNIPETSSQEPSSAEKAVILYIAKRKGTLTAKGGTYSD